MLFKFYQNLVASIEWFEINFYCRGIKNIGEKSQQISLKSLFVGLHKVHKQDPRGN